MRSNWRFTSGRSIAHPANLVGLSLAFCSISLLVSVAEAQTDSNGPAVKATAVASGGGGLPVVSAPPMVSLPGQIAPAVTQAQLLGSNQASGPIDFLIALPLRNQAALSQLQTSLYNPQDPLYGQYLTPAQFADQFGPTQASVNAVIAYAQAQGFTVLSTQPSRTLVVLRATQAQIQTAFQIQLGQYQDSTGHIFFAPTSDPMIPASLSGTISGIIGLSNISVLQPLLHRRKMSMAKQPRSLMFRDAGDPPPLSPDALPGTGLGNGLIPSDIKTAYNLNNNNLTGVGQSIAIYELDTYSGKDIQRYELDFGVPATRSALGLSTYVPLSNINVGTGYLTTPGSATDEVVLDIDMMIAVAPGISKIYVYNALNGSSYSTQEYAQIADDNLAKQVSTSWGIYEAATSTGERSSQDAAFSQMSTQGQSIYCASGDYGSYDNTSGLAVLYPASDPFMCGVGGTTLTVQSAGSNEAYKSETVWNYNNEGGAGVSGGYCAGGGGVTSISTNTIPSYQSAAASYSSGVAAAAGVTSGISKTLRNVPDVSLNASDGSPFVLYISPSGGTAGYYYIYGTSAAAPLWAGFTALVNENRLLNGSGYLGFPNLTLYPLAPTATNTNGASNNYTTIFHDITTGNNSTPTTSTLYPAVYGYDCASGLGTFNGNNLLIQLSGSLPTTQH